jgi:hypothetical protein
MTYAPQTLKDLMALPASRPRGASFHATAPARMHDSSIRRLHQRAAVRRCSPGYRHVRAGSGFACGSRDGLRSTLEAPPLVWRCARVFAARDLPGPSRPCRACCRGASRGTDDSGAHRAGCRSDAERPDQPGPARPLSPTRVDGRARPVLGTGTAHAGKRGSGNPSRPSTRSTCRPLPRSGRRRPHPRCDSRRYSSTSRGVTCQSRPTFVARSLPRATCCRSVSGVTPSNVAASLRVTGDGPCRSGVAAGELRHGRSRDSDPIGDSRPAAATLAGASSVSAAARTRPSRSDRPIDHPRK